MVSKSLPKLCRIIFSVQTILIYGGMQEVFGFNVDIRSASVYSGPPGSYFGFSVGLLVNNNHQRVIVGAPRDQGNQPSVNRSGAVYECDVDVSPSNHSNNCIQMAIDPTGNLKDGGWTNYKYTDHKTDQWMGYNLAFSDGTPSKMATCAPLWANAYYPGNYLINGLCYEKDKTVTQMRPLLYLDRQIDKDDHYNYAFGQAGISITYPKRRTGVRANLAMGAPGLRAWTGGMVVVSALNTYITEYSKFKKDALIGYAINSGYVYDKKEIVYLLGAPKLDAVGEVLIANERDYQLKDYIRGDQLGSYFGAAVCTVDFNGDQLDDIVVGAPLYSDKYHEEGRVYVYVNHGAGFTRDPLLLPGPRKTVSRFGQAVVNLGDINLDNFEDLAVGAPYEDDSRGAIYIYNGDSNGIQTTVSQRITGKTLRPGIRAFGWSISRAEDMDSNKYPDFVVGAYKSEHAILFRGRPVVKIKAELKISHPLIARDASGNLNVSLCLKYYGTHVPNKIDINYTLAADTIKSNAQRAIRAKFLRLSSLIGSFDGNKQLQDDVEECELFPVAIEMQSIRDFLTPIQFEAQFSLVDSQNGLASTAPPILDRVQETHLSKRATFQTNCGADEICETDLSVNMADPIHEDAPYLIINKTSTLIIPLEVKNSREPAFEALLILTIPNHVNYTGIESSHPVQCSLSDSSQRKTSVKSNSKLQCNLGNPLSSGTEIKLKVKLNVRGVPLTDKQLQLRANVSSTSEERKETIHDNVKTLSVATRLETRLHVEGKSSPEQFTYTTDAHKDEAIKLFNVTYSLSISNAGPSALPSGEIYILFPVGEEDDTGTDFMPLDHLKVSVENTNCSFSNNQVLPSGKLIESGRASVERPEQIPVLEYNQTWLTGEVPTPDFNDTWLLLTPQSTNATPSGKGLDLGTKVSRKRRDTPATTSSKKVHDVVVSCATHRCLPVICRAEKLSVGDKIILNLSLSLFEKAIANIKPGKVIEYQIEVTVEPKNSSNYAPLLDDEQIHQTLATPFFPAKPKSEDVALWIIILSSVAGFLLLVIIAVVLWKMGFFKRNQHETVQDWKRNSGYNSGSKRSSSHRSSAASRPPLSPPPPIDGQEPT